VLLQSVVVVGYPAYGRETAIFVLYVSDDEIVASKTSVKISSKRVRRFLRFELFIYYVSTGKTYGIRSAGLRNVEALGPSLAAAPFLNYIYPMLVHYRCIPCIMYQLYDNLLQNNILFKSKVEQI